MFCLQYIFSEDCAVYEIMWEKAQTKVISVFNQLDAQNLFHNKFYFMPLHVSSTVLIIRRSKL